MKFAIADPPYYGYSEKFYGDLHGDAADYDKLKTHQELIERLDSEYDGWALHMTSGNLHDILPLCPNDARVMAWVKPFASFKKNVTVAYAWEPVIIKGGRKRPITENTVRDWCAENITLKRGLVGAKPAKVVWWILDIFYAQPEDEVHDIFPGSGAVTNAIEAWREAQLGGCNAPLFAT